MNIQLFSSKEEKINKWFKKLRKKLYNKYLFRLPSANLLTFFGFCSMIAFFISSMYHKYYLGYLFILLYLIFDGLDGTVAREREGETFIGSLHDLISDLLGYLLFLIAISISFKIEVELVMWYYIFHVFYVFIIILRNNYNIPYKFSLRCKNLLYLTYIFFIGRTHIYQFIFYALTILIIMHIAYGFYILHKKIYELENRKFNNFYQIISLTLIVLSLIVVMNIHVFN